MVKTLRLTRDLILSVYFTQRSLTPESTPLCRHRDTRSVKIQIKNLNQRDERHLQVNAQVTKREMVFFHISGVQY